MSLPTVAIVGRPNVGKSSLFNRFIQRQLAVVHETAGITRDRNYAVCDWNGREFRLIDTGGMVPAAEELMDRMILEQTEFAIAEADLVLFIVDTQTGADHIDKSIARRLAQSGKPTLVIANKTDNDEAELEIYEFFRLGLGDPIPASAMTGRGVGDLLDQVVDKLPEEREDTGDDEGTIRVAVVGKPNVGKSSFINKLTGSDRAIVTPIAGTTRDSVDTPFEYDGQQYIMVDTAGLRRKYKVTENVEFYTNLRTTRAMESADIAVILIDAAEGVTAQDQHILEEVLGSRRSAVLVVNKWDLIEKDSRTADEFTREIKSVIAQYSYLPIIYISALSGQRVAKVLALVKQVYDESRKRIGTAELNEFLQKTVGRQHPPSRAGKFIKFNYMTQTEIAPPTFVIFANHPTLIDKSYVNYLANQIRAEYGFAGVPFRLKFRRK